MKRISLMVAAVFSVGAVQAADLLEVYGDAMASDAKLASARAQLEAGKEKGLQGRAGLLPTATLNAATSFTDNDATVPAVRETRYNTNTYDVQISQPLFRWQNWIAAKQGELQVGIAQAQYAGAQMDIILRTAQAYLDVLYAEDALSTVQFLKAAAGEQLQLGKKSFEVGTVTITDVNEAQSRFDLAAAQEIAAQNDVAVKRQALRLLTGKEPQGLARLRSGVTLALPQPANMDQWVSIAEESNVDVQAQRLAAEVATRELERSRAGHLPTLDAVASYGNSHVLGSASSGSQSLSTNWSVGLRFSVPLYQGGGTQSKVRETYALADKARADLDLARRNAAQSARQYYLGVTNGVAQVKGYEAALVSSKSSLESNKLGYQVGVRINIDVLNAQTQVADTQQKLARARYDAVLAQLRLKQAVGALSIKDLQQVNDLLER